jgi:hypothetical protein
MHNRDNRPLTGYHRSSPVFFGFPADTNRSRSRLEPVGPNNRTGPDFQALEKSESTDPTPIQTGQEIVT